MAILAFGDLVLDVLLMILIYGDCLPREHDGAKPPHDHIFTD